MHLMDFGVIRPIHGWEIVNNNQPAITGRYTDFLHVPLLLALPLERWIMEPRRTNSHGGWGPTVRSRGKIPLHPFPTSVAWLIEERIMESFFTAVSQPHTFQSSKNYSSERSTDTIWGRQMCRKFASETWCMPALWPKTSYLLFIY